jgi:hypothetical protein
MADETVKSVEEEKVGDGQVKDEVMDEHKSQQEEKKQEAPVEKKEEKAEEKKETSEKKEEKKEIVYSLKLPEGSKLQKAQADEIAAYAKEQGLSKEQAQKQLERESKLASDFETQSLNQLKEATGQWLEAVKTDKEIGGEGFPKNAELAKRVVTRFGTPEFKAELERTGLGNHPELVRVFVRIGQAMSDDQFVQPGSQSTPKKDIAEKFYGGEKKE